MSDTLSFQQVILKLHEFWSQQGCVIWRPHNVQVGAGTANPGTTLRVLGREPWRVAYIEPSVRPDDGRYGENPNRFQMHTQYQVILKPDPGNSQELYLQSLEAIGLNPREHDIRFVEDNWESPALGAWGLGWEVWLDGQEITQFTYFQQAGGLELNPVSVELTYGLERIVLALQNKPNAWEIAFTDLDEVAKLTYGDIFLRAEYEHSKYYFEIADIDALKHSYDIYEGEFRRAVEAGVLLPAYDYVLKCSHTFNVLDTRGAIGVTERAQYFRRMRDMTRLIAKAYVEQREALAYPLEKFNHAWGAPALAEAPALPSHVSSFPTDFLLEIGVEELPAQDVDLALEQVQALAIALFDDLRIQHNGVRTYGTPRRIVVMVRGVAPQQMDATSIVKGPAADRAFDAEGKPTKAALGFASGRGVDVSALRIEEVEGGRYVFAEVFEKGRPTVEVLAEELPKLLATIKFGKAMRWNDSQVAFSRPLRWFVALLGEAVVPFTYAGVASGNITRGLRPYGSPLFNVRNIEEYLASLKHQGIMLDRDERREQILVDARRLAHEAGGTLIVDEALLDEVANLVECPTPFVGTFAEASLELPAPVLITVMRKHQRYFAIQGENGLLPKFIAVRNGDREHLDQVIAGNEAVLRARYADAAFFFAEDRKKPLAAFFPRLSTLTFHEKVGSMLDKNNRVVGLVAVLGELLGMNAETLSIAEQAAQVMKADLATQMVVEMTSLQGVMGREYALREGYPPLVADAIFEHWLPRSADDSLPNTPAGILLALADRLDTLVSLFAVGLAPKGNADPFGLRRAALGVVQILTHHAIDLDLTVALERVARAQSIEVSVESRQTLADFIRGRLEGWLTEHDHAHDVMVAVLAEQAHNPTRALAGIQQLGTWVQQPDWETTLDSFARCIRITRNETTLYTVDPSAFVEQAERRLHDALTQAHATLTATDNVGAFLQVFAPLVPIITDFFNEVLVNAEEPQVRQNRLGLLQQVGLLARGRADMSQLSGF